MNVGRYTIPDGDRGIRKTVKKMRALVHESMADPLTVETAASIVGPYCCGPERIQAIRDFLVGHLVFTPDPRGYELLRAPGYLLERIFSDGLAYGDCDDVAILGAALGVAAYFPARFVLVGFSPRDPFSHVFTELLDNQGWAELDTTAPAQFPAGLQVHKMETMEV